MIKKLTVSALILLLSLCLFACYKKPDLTGVEQKTVTVKKLYEKDGDWECAQGLGCDGAYFYYAGHHDKTNEQADIHVINAATGKEEKCFSRKGALHSAEVAVNRLRNTVTACSGGDGRRPYLFELDIATGEKLNEWYFDGMGENGGGLHCFTEDGTLIFFTSSKDGARIAFNTINLKYDGTGSYTVSDSYYFSRTDLGVPQGLDYYDGYVYYLSDAGRTVDKNPHYIYKIGLKNGAVNLECAYSFDFTEETEGLFIDTDGTVYIGAADECIYRFDKKISEW